MRPLIDLCRDLDDLIPGYGEEEVLVYVEVDGGYIVAQVTGVALSDDRIILRTKTL